MEECTGAAERGQIAAKTTAFAPEIPFEMAKVRQRAAKRQFATAEFQNPAPVTAQLAKEAILEAFNTTLEAGLEFGRKNFYMLFAAERQKEGMEAFVEKRKPTWRGK